jgi:hypothetical protein
LKRVLGSQFQATAKIDVKNDEDDKETHICSSFILLNLWGES